MAVKQLFLLLSLFMTVLAKSYNRGNVCTLHQGDCSYKITLIDSQCRNGMLNDGTANVLPVDYGNQYKYNKIDAFLPEDDEEPNNEQADNAVTIKKLDELEKRLIKMMEGLSVRSLRHIRQIRNDLHQMSTSMSLLKAGGLKGKGRRSAKIDCPPEFIRVGMWNSCYRFSTFAESWHNAREYCSAFGADLVALDTIKESYILDYLIKSNRDYDEPKGWWTAGNYIARNQRWMWTTKHHLKEITYNRWAPQEPNARSTMHCMLLYKNAAYRWHDATCSDKHNFICEIEIV